MCRDPDVDTLPIEALFVDVLGSVYAPLTLACFFQLDCNGKEINNLELARPELSTPLSGTMGTFCVCAVPHSSTELWTGG